MLTTQNSILCVIDIQERLFPHIHSKEDFLKNTIALIKGARILEIPILSTEQLPDKIGKTIPEISPLLENTQPIVKAAFSCCGEVKFISALSAHPQKQILLCGIETHVCVYQTARDLINLGYDVSVVADAVSSRTLENKEIGLERIQESGASVTSVETALFELLKIADGEKFKEILKLIK